MNNSWLYDQLTKHSHLKVEDNYYKFIQVVHKNKTYKIYTPTPDEYLITVDIVQKVKKLGATTVSYPTSWCRPSAEALTYGKDIGISVIPHAALFNMLDVRT